MGEDGGSSRGNGNWGGRMIAERKSIKRTGVLENSPWERFLRSLPPSSFLSGRGWFPQLPARRREGRGS